MKIKIVAVGNVKEKFYKDACDEYIKRLGRFCDVEIVEVAEKNNCPNASATLTLEAKDIIKHLSGYVVVMDIKGKMLDSVELSKHIENVKLESSCITFVIGSSYGLDDSVKKLANFSLSMSKMTFPHQLARLLVLEQIYRAMCIANNITYHK